MKLSIGYDPAKGLTREIVIRHGLTVEVAAGQFAAGAAAVADLATSVHLPWHDSDIGRLNYAAEDREFRSLCRRRLKAAVTRAAAVFPAVRLAVMHGAPQRWMSHEIEGGRTGTYEEFIAGLREIADVAARHGIVLTLENNNLYWVDAAGKITWENAEPSTDMHYFGCGPDEWLKAFRDAAHANLRLCFDTAHACTWAHAIPEPAARVTGLLAYLREPAAIAHVHWNGHHAFEPEGRVDKHLNVGTGTIPLEMHRRIRDLDASHLLEHFHGEEALATELAFIRGL